MATTTYDSPMLATERCDRCNAQALVRVEIGDLALLFCGHDFALHESKVSEVATHIDDHRPSLGARGEAPQPV